MSGRRRPVWDRFWAKVARGRPDECWLWVGAVNADGYGVFRLKPRDGGTGSEQGRLVYAHRLAVMFQRGPIPPELPYVRHLCAGRYPPGNVIYRLCCNHAHLEPGTEAENNMDTYEQGRRPRRWGEPKQLDLTELLPPLPGPA